MEMLKIFNVDAIEIVDMVSKAASVYTYGSAIYKSFKNIFIEDPVVNIDEVKETIIRNFVDTVSVKSYKNLDTYKIRDFTFVDNNGRLWLRIYLDIE